MSEERKQDKYAVVTRGSWRLLLSTVWIKTNGVPLLSSQAEKHHVRDVCSWFFSLSCHNQLKAHCHKRKDTAAHALSVNTFSSGGMRSTDNKQTSETEHAGCLQHGRHTHGLWESEKPRLTNDKKCSSSSDHLRQAPKVSGSPFLIKFLLFCLFLCYDLVSKQLNNIGKPYLSQ